VTAAVGGLNPRPLDGKVAIVTGGSRGLGREIALGFAGAGASIVVASRNSDACRAVVDEIREATGQRAEPYVVHVGHWSELSGLVDFAGEEFGRLDILVNNAGLSPTYGSLAEVSEELFDKVIAVNVKGPFRLSALAGERMIAGGGGAIINISTTGSLHGEPVALPYTAAKAALNNVTEGFARSLGPTVRVNAILAGPFLTDIAKHWDMEAFEADARGYPLRRAGQPNEIVGAAVYLASDAASFTTGALLTVDGGQRFGR